MTSSATVGLVFVLSVQLLLFLSSTAAGELNPGSSFTNVNGSLIDGQMQDSSGIPGALPSGEGDVEPPSGIFYTDFFRSAKSWITGVPGISFIYNVLVAPYSVLAMTGLPVLYVNALGSFWYLLMLFVFVAFLWGRE